MDGETLQGYLDEIGLTHQQAADLLGVHARQRVGDWVRGKRRMSPYAARHLETLVTAHRIGVLDALMDARGE